jgi:arylamine N-acetyltransferase
MPTLDDALAEAYLARLGVDARRGEVDAATLAALQRAHLAAVPYENLDIVLGTPPPIDPLACARRVVAGRGGYCFHLNGAFAALLEWLGADLTRHLSGVQGRRAAVPPGANGNHLGLTVRADGATWLVDAGLGDGPPAPLPLAPGTYEQDGFVFRLEPSPLVPGGWRLHHDPRGAFVLVDVAAGPASTHDFAGMHEELSTSAASHFVTGVAVMRRLPGAVEVLRGCTFATLTADGAAERVLTTSDEWWSVVLDHFGLTYGGLDAAGRDGVWHRARAAQEEWEAARR